MLITILILSVSVNLYLWYANRFMREEVEKGNLRTSVATSIIHLLQFTSRRLSSELKAERKELVALRKSEQKVWRKQQKKKYKATHGTPDYTPNSLSEVNNVTHHYRRNGTRPTIAMIDRRINQRGRLEERLRRARIVDAVARAMSSRITESGAGTWEVIELP